MELRKLNKSAKEHKELKAIFLEAFPPEERPPYWFLRRKADSPGVEMSALYDGEKPVGFIYLIKGGELAYLFLLAVKSGERGRGYGRQAMELITEKYRGSKLFLALERMDDGAENYTQRLRRHRFYESCGLRDLPYRVKEANVVYDMMGMGGTVKPEEYLMLMDGFTGRFIRRLIGMKLLARTSD